MRVLQCLGESLFVPRSRRPQKDEFVGDLCPIAKRAIDRGTNVSLTRCRIGDPWSILERGPVTHVLTVETAQLRDPVTFVVSMKS